MMPLSAPQALDQFFLDARCKLLDLAAILDRLQRGAHASQAIADPRVRRILDALAVLQSTSPNRAEQIQHIFSQHYDPNWKRPDPR